jgi:glycerophosphoryl diester phosphodiesterase
VISRRLPLLPDRKRPLIFAHRGCSSLAPENTLAAFNKARETGAPGIELDIHPTADGKIVVAHDDTFVRTAPPDHNGGGKEVEELSYDEIRRIDVGSFFGSPWSAERPPLLEDALESFCPAMYVDIELKSRKVKDDPLPGLLAEKLRSLGSRINGAITVSSFNPFCLLSFKQIWQTARGGDMADIPTAIIFCVSPEVPWLLRRGFGRIISRCDYLKPVHAQSAGLSRLYWQLIEKRPVVPWTVDDRALAMRLVSPLPAGISGCAGIITNRPQDMTGLGIRLPR